jgi:RNA polymerase sigma factor (sigma-70 family)
MLSTTSRREPSIADQELIQRILSDPNEGWKEFQATYDRFLLKVTRRFDLAKEDEEEVYQEICLQLVKNDFKVLRAWKPERCSLPHFLTIIATHAVIDFVKSPFHTYTRRKSDLDRVEGRPEAVIETFEDLTYSPAERLQRLQLVEVLRATLDRWIWTRRFKTEDRLLIEFRLRGLSYKEISARLGVSVSYATGRFTRLKSVLRRGLEDAGISLSEIPDESPGPRAA